MEDLGETGMMQRATPGTNFGEQAANSAKPGGDRGGPDEKGL